MSCSSSISSACSNGCNFATEKAAAIVAIPAQILLEIAFIGTGVITHIGNIAALGTSYKMNTQTKNTPDEKDSFLKMATDTLISETFANCIKVFNPNADFDFTQNTPKDLLDFGTMVRESFENKARTYSRSKNVFVRHVVSRLTYLLMPVATVIARVVALPIGLIAAVFSLISLGHWTKANRIAYKNLQILTVLDDLLWAITRVINPWPGTQLA